MAGAGGGATAGMGGAAIGGSGGVVAGTGGAAVGAGGAVGGAGGGLAGTSGAAGFAGTGGGAAEGDPIRLMIFYTRWGTSYPEWFPTGSERAFTMSTMMHALEPYKQELIVLSGLTNANYYAGNDPALSGADANDSGDAMLTLLTARPAARGQPAGGPSLDTAVGDCRGAAGPPLRLAVGQFGYDDNPGISFDAGGAPIRGERDPHAAAVRVLGHDVTAPDPAADIDVSYPAIGAAQMDVAVEALAKAKTCAVTLMWGDQVVLESLGLTDLIHNVSHFATNDYDAFISANPMSDPGSPFVKLQAWYAAQFASLLARFKNTPLGGGSLLDRSVIVWISESGVGGDHRGSFIPIVIAGRAGGRLDVGRYLQIKPRPMPPADVFTIARTQGDLLAALAGLWGMPTFGDPRITRQPLTEILLP